VNGALTVGENIGDLGGLSIAWKAYLISLNGEESPVIDGLSGAQRFFFAWVQTWRLKARKEEVERLLAIDPHSPDEFRGNQIVRNVDEFYESFDVTESDAMWLEPAARVTIGNSVALGAFDAGWWIGGVESESESPTRRDHRVDETVGNGVVGRHEIVAVDVVYHLVDGPSTVVAMISAIRLVSARASRS